MLAMYRSSLELNMDKSKTEKLYNMIATRFAGDYKFYSRIRRIMGDYLEKRTIRRKVNTRLHRLNMKEEIRKRMLINLRAKRMNVEYDD